MVTFFALPNRARASGHSDAVVGDGLGIDLVFAPDLGTEPWVQNQHPSGNEVVGEAVNGCLKPLQGDHVADRAEHAHNSIELVIQVKGGHVALVQRHTRPALGGNAQHLGRGVESGDLIPA